MSDELENVKTCIDRILPVQRVIEAANRSINEHPANRPASSPTDLERVSRGLPAGVPPHAVDERVRIAILTGNKWQPGRALRVMFLDGDPRVQRKVQEVAHEWERYANVKLEFGFDPDAEVRISFRDNGSWSYIGTQCLSIPKSSPTMNYGWLTPQTSDEEYHRVVLHEFGHALGCIHEHQNPTGNIHWNKPAVYQYFSGSPNFWSREEVDHNLFDKYSKNITQFTTLDPTSIMMYSFPKEFTTDGFSAPMNTHLSETDKSFMGSIYPGAGTSETTELILAAAAAETAIGKHGEVDLYHFQTPTAGHYTIETQGRTDVVMQLFGPDSQLNLIAEDDDSGQGFNARISRNLAPGSYYIKVRHYRPAGTGKYKISVHPDA